MALISWPLDVMRDEIVWVMALGVFTFHMLLRAQKQTLLSLLVISCFAYVGFVYLNRRAEKVRARQTDEDTFFRSEAAWRNEAHQQAFAPTRFPRNGFKYLRENSMLVDIAKELAALRRYDRARYGDVLLFMDALQKVYIRTLEGRVNAKTSVGKFMDLREGILENMYSFYLVIPPNMPSGVLRKSIENFARLSQMMIEVLKSYSKKAAKEPSFPVLAPSAADRPFDPMRNRRLP